MSAFNRAALALAPLALLSACAGEQVKGNVYEGLKAREAEVHPQLGTGAPEKPMTYEQYQAERRKLLEQEKKKAGPPAPNP